ncbi:MAG: hypothetical protein WAN43_09480 [Rhodomicrobium sp.]|jgi:hypothetical protein
MMKSFGDAFPRTLRAGHRVEALTPFASEMGRAEAVVLEPNASISGAFDAKLDGGGAAY